MSHQLLRRLTAVLAALTLSSCTVGIIEVRPASEAEQIPQPVFLVSSPTAQNQRPVYSRIRVFDTSDGCQTPYCAMVWQVVVSEQSSPQKITYGAIPAFGSYSIASPRELETGRTYQMILDQRPDSPLKEAGVIDFTVSQDGMIIVQPPPASTSCDKQ